MPKIPFDFRRIAPKTQVAGAVPESLSPYQQNIQSLQKEQQSRRQLASSVLSAVGTGAQIFTQQTDEQDSSDMVAARAAILRLNQDENQAISSTSDPKHIARIGAEYNKKYDEIMTGDVEGFDRPYFRNQSGRDRFKTSFQDGFNLQRLLSADKSIYNLDRRNTSANLENGIKSARSASYYDQPRAEVETVEFIQRLIEYNYLTPAEGVERKRVSLISLDTERASRKLTDLNPGAQTDFNGSGAINPINMQVSQYKEYVEGLKHLTPQQKAEFSHNADSVLYNVKQATKAAEKERDIELEKNQLAYENDYFQAVIEGKVEFASMFSNPDLSEKFKKTHLTTYARKTEEYNKLIKKENKTAEDKLKATQKTAEYDKINSVTANQALIYDSSRDDPQGTIKAALLNKVYESVGMEPQFKTYLANVIKGSEGQPSHIKASRDNHITDFKRLLGLTKESFDIFKEVDLPGIGTGDKAMVDAETGVKTVDGLDQFTRTKVMNDALIKYDSLMKEGKEEKAEEYIIKVKNTYEKSQDDTKLYDRFFTEKIIYRK